MSKINQDLYNNLIKASNIISKRSKSNGNYMIVSPIIADLLENLDIKKHRKKKLMRINEISKKSL